MFYYFNGRLPLTSSLLIVPDGEVSEGTEKVNLKLFYEMFKDTQSHGLVFICFYSISLCTWNIFWGKYFNTKIYAYGTV